MWLYRVLHMQQGEKNLRNINVKVRGGTRQMDKKYLLNIGIDQSATRPAKRFICYKT